MARIAITGGTGFIGRNLVALAQREGHVPVVLTRDPTRARVRLGEDVECVAWDPFEARGPWEDALRGADAVVNLAGEPIEARRWNEPFKQLLRDSRILGTRHLVAALARMDAPPKVLVNGSATNFYGRTDGDAPVREDGRLGDGFVPTMIADWEREARVARDAGIRVVLLRIACVLGDRGGGLEQAFKHFLFYLGGPLGGRQWVPWIHVDDMARVIVRAIDEVTIEGPVNCSTPRPVRMDEFAREIGRALDRPSWLTLPRGLVRAMIGEMADILLDGANAHPGVLTELGFAYRYPELPAALRATLKPL